jgi:hypothetical protein
MVAKSLVVHEIPAKSGAKEVNARIFGIFTPRLF